MKSDGFATSWPPASCKLHHDACDVLQLTHLSTGAKMHVLAQTHEFPHIPNTCLVQHVAACQPSTGGSSMWVHKAMHQAKSSQISLKSAGGRFLRAQNGLRNK